MRWLTCDLNSPNDIDIWDREPVFYHRYGIWVTPQGGDDYGECDSLTRAECVERYGMAPPDPLSMVRVIEHE